MSSGCGSPVLRGSPAGIGALRVEPAISPVLVREIHNSDVVRQINASGPEGGEKSEVTASPGPMSLRARASCQKDDLRARPDPARGGHEACLADRSKGAIEMPARGEQQKGLGSPIYGCSDTESLARTVGSPGRARAAGRGIF